MQNLKIRESRKTFIVLCLLSIIAFLPAPVAAEESNNMQINALKDGINRVLSSELEKNPDLKSCKITVDIDLEKDAESGKWSGNISKIIATSGDNLSDEVDSSESTVTDDDIDNEFTDDDTDSDNESADEDSDGGGNILGRIIGSAFVIVMIFAIFSWLKPKFEEMHVKPDDKKQHDDVHHHSQTRRDDSLDNEHQNNYNSDESKSNKGYQVETRPFVAQHQPVDKPVPQESTVEKNLSTVITQEPVASVPTVPITKYGQIAVLSQNELITEEDYMSDEAAGMPFVFSFSPNMEEGTYDISSSSRTSFLRDVNIIRPFVQDFDDVSNPTKIVTITEGKLRRKGLSWMVTDKLKIQLI